MNEPDPAPPPPTPEQIHRETLRGHALAGVVTAGFAALLWMIARAMESRLAMVAALVTMLGAILYAFTAAVFAARVPRSPPAAVERDES